MTEITPLFNYDTSVPGVERARRWMEDKVSGGFFDRLRVRPHRSR